MPPRDPSPLGDEMASTMPEPRFPEPEPGKEHGSPASEQAVAGGNPTEPDFDQRPALPDHPERMAADIEDEEADPVIDSGPGIADGPKGPQKQRG